MPMNLVHRLMGASPYQTDSAVPSPMAGSRLSCLAHDQVHFGRGGQNTDEIVTGLYLTPTIGKELIRLQSNLRPGGPVAAVVAVDKGQDRNIQDRYVFFPELADQGKPTGRFIHHKIVDGGQEYVSFVFGLDEKKKTFYTLGWFSNGNKEPLEDLSEPDSQEHLRQWRILEQYGQVGLLGKDNEFTPQKMTVETLLNLSVWHRIKANLPAWLLRLFARD
jgi:hypothetical protein